MKKSPKESLRIRGESGRQKKEPSGEKARCFRLVSYKSCPILCDPMNQGPPGFSAHEICQSSILEWVAVSFSRVSSQTRHQTASPALQMLYC